MPTAILETSPEIRHEPDRARSGHGRLTLECAGGQTVVTRASAHSPLKLLVPRPRGLAAWIFTSTYGGGLVGGDQISLDIDAASKSRCLLSTQASTKIYRTDGPPCRQDLNVIAGSDAIVVSMPDPIVCFAGSKFKQQQQFDLAEDAGLVMLDWFTSGRRAHGERWAFDRYESRTEITVEGRCVFRDEIVLDPLDGSLNSPNRMGSCNCFATIIVAGNAVLGRAQELLKFVAQKPISRDPSILFSASAMDGGVVCRIAGCETEAITGWIRERLAFVAELVGENPWDRKW